MAKPIDPDPADEGLLSARYEPASGDAESINLQLGYTDRWRGRWHHVRPQTRWAWVRAVAWAAVGSVLLGFAVAWLGVITGVGFEGWRAMNSFWVGVCAVLVLIPLLSAGQIAWHFWAEWRGRDERTRQRLLLGQEELVVFHRDRITRDRWPDVAHFRLSEEAVTLGPSWVDVLYLPRTAVADDAAWQRIKRRVLQQLGQCGKCGYPFQGLEADACPECGTSVDRAISLQDADRKRKRGFRLSRKDPDTD